jgi:hypothetical protein
MMLDRARLFLLLVVVALFGQAAMPALHAAMQPAGSGRTAALDICSADGKVSSVSLPLGKTVPAGHMAEDCPCCVGAGSAAPMPVFAQLPITTGQPVEQAVPIYALSLRKAWFEAQPRAPPLALA